MRNIYNVTDEYKRYGHESMYLLCRAIMNEQFDFSYITSMARLVISRKEESIGMIVYGAMDRGSFSYESELREIGDKDCFFMDLRIGDTYRKYHKITIKEIISLLKQYYS